MQAVDPLVIAKLYDSVGRCSWYLLGYDPKTKFSLASIVDEYGQNASTVSVETLENSLAKRDFSFQQRLLSQVLTI